MFLWMHEFSDRPANAGMALVSLGVGGHACEVLTAPFELLTRKPAF